MDGWEETVVDNFCPVRIGGRTSRFATRNGLCANTSSSRAAPATLPSSSASQMPRFCSGSKSMESRAERLPRPGLSSIGACRAATIRCGTGAANSTRNGSAASRQIDRRSTQAEHGRMLAHWYGSETTRHASDATCIAASKRTCRFTSITSFRLRSLNCAPIRQISSYFAKSAITSFIQGRM